VSTEPWSASSAGQEEKYKGLKDPAAEDVGRGVEADLWMPPAVTTARPT